MLDEEELRKGTFFGYSLKRHFSAILLVFANKQDMEGAMSPTEIAKELGLASLR